MDSDDEFDLMLLAIVLIKKKAKVKKRESMGNGHLKESQNFWY